MGKTAQKKGGLFVQTFYKICLILMIVGGIWFPASRAMRIDPAVAIKDE